MRVVAIDPGMSTGVVSAVREGDDVIIDARWQVEGGLGAPLLSLLDGLFQDPALEAVVMEKFSPLPTARAYRLKELEPIRIEGAVQAMVAETSAALFPQRTMSLTIGGVTGGSPRENKKAADNVLREHQLWTTGRQVSCKDADDVNAAMKHLVAWARSEGWPALDKWRIEL